MASSPYTPGKLIGKGGFASVYEAAGMDGKLVLKTEPVTQDAQIPHEYEIYCQLKGVPVVPKVLQFVTEPDCYVLIMENAGNDLPKFLTESRDILLVSLRSYYSLLAFCASKMILVLQEVHSKGIIHGDIHPSNFTTRVGSTDIDFFLIDFGAAKEVGKSVLPKDGIQINYEFASKARTLSPSCGKPPPAK